MAKPRDPTALKVARGKSHMTKDEIDDGLSREIYASIGEISMPDWLDGPAADIFEREAAYMRRVNVAAGVAIYGDTDSEPLAVMASSYARYLHYKGREEKAREGAERQRYNSMKNKEAATYERIMRLLKLDPSSRVDFAGLKGGQDDGKQDCFANI